MFVVFVCLVKHQLSFFQDGDAIGLGQTAIEL